MTDLAALRHELDGIDDSLHDLLMRRAALVGRIGATKRAAGVGRLRPGREAAILRRLLARHQGALLPTSIVAIWREILAGSLALQGAFTLAFADPALDRVARSQFGAHAATRLAPHTAAALDLVCAGAAEAALIDAAGPDSAFSPDWALLLDRPSLMVVARLPFVASVPLVPAWLVMPCLPDPSGDDHALLALDGPAAADLALLGPMARQIGRHHATLLFDRPGFATAPPAFLACPARLIGAYAVPLP